MQFCNAAAVVIVDSSDGSKDVGTGRAKGAMAPTKF